MGSQPFIHPSYILCRAVRRKTLQTKLFSGKRFILFAHSLSLSFSFISSAPSHNIALFVCSFHSFTRWLVGWFWSDSRKTHTISTVRFMLYVLHIYVWLLRSPVTTVPLCIRCACPKDYARQEHTKKECRNRIVGKKDSSRNSSGSSSRRNPLSYRMLHSFGMVQSHICDCACECVFGSVVYVCDGACLRIDQLCTYYHRIVVFEVPFRVAITVVGSSS